MSLLSPPLCHWLQKLLAESPVQTVELILDYSLCHVIHSFIHSGNLYSAPSRKLLRGAPSPATFEKEGLKSSKEAKWRINLRERTQVSWKAIPSNRTNHREGPMLDTSQTSTRNHKLTSCSRAEHSTRGDQRAWPAEVP